MADIYDGPPREGTRGGLEQFTWDSIKGQVLRDRECYLGQSVRVGVQGKFGRFSTNDWWSRKRDDPQKISEERNVVRRFEEELMQEALGVKPKRLLLIKGDLTEDQKKELLGPDDASADTAVSQRKENRKRSHRRMKNEFDRTHSASLSENVSIKRSRNERQDNQYEVEESSGAYKLQSRTSGGRKYLSHGDSDLRSRDRHKRPEWFREQSPSPYHRKPQQRFYRRESFLGKEQKPFASAKFH